ncbi:Spo0E family sporulation regulatory protein-aspartic acid phosphatase [Thalassobacillus hwangdonensis]|uniref:Spo0E family sporulation regulatory protein-aspartic acid phosphatase n=2 Tax=Thalassobacillus hwangdonensis TaxID=546108 RepID=A0ABW3KY30_9BACI
MPYLHMEKNDDELFDEIQRYRKKMYVTAEGYGRGSERTIKESQNLDKLIVEYMRRQAKVS